jgi:two-component system LytT family response regulator
MIRTLIAEDEPIARERMRRLLSQEEGVELVGECKDGDEAVALVRQLKPDLLFLDVEMPGRDGFSVLSALGNEVSPVVIFTTAYDHYAVKAFEIHAVDYLLKPFDQLRFRRALERARNQVVRAKEKEDVTQRMRTLLKDVEPGSSMGRLVIRSGGRVVFLRVSEIDWIEAAGNYVRVHCQDQTHLVRETMNQMESKLDGKRFVRIHRSIIVNVESIRELEPCGNGEYIVHVRGGKGLSLSRGYRSRLDAILGVDSNGSNGTNGTPQ